MKVALSKPQQDFGVWLVKDYATKHGIDYPTAVGILADAQGFKSVWEWVNLDIFLCNERAVT